MLPNYNKEIFQIEEDILSDKIISGQLLKDCIIRHRDDLENGYKRGIHFDTEIGQDVLDFATELNGYNGLPAILFWWQKLELYYFFGWRKGKYRRYDTMYCSMARKNQKTITRPPKVLYHLLFEDEEGPEVYISATKEKQAQICFDDIVKIIENNQELADEFKVLTTSISSKELNAKIGFLTSNPKTADGTRPSYSIIDEYHEFDDDGMLNKLKTGSIVHKNVIFEIITTRGSDKSKPCYIKEQKVFIPILKGQIIEDSVFVLIFSPDDGDQPDDVKTWFKANPNLGITLDVERFKKDYTLAVIQGEEAINSFKTLNLNMWVDAPKVVIKDDDWMKGKRNIRFEDFYGKRCIGGFDMGLIDDFASLCLIFPDVEKDDFDSELDFLKKFSGTAFWWFWITSDSIQKRVSRGLSSIRDWVKDGHINVCEGNYNSFTQIQNDIDALSKLVNIEAIGFDRAYIGSIAEGMMLSGIDAIDIPQKAWIPFEVKIPEIEEEKLKILNLKSSGISKVKDIHGNELDKYIKNIGLSPSSQWLKEIVTDGRIKHDGNPVIRWMAQNVVQLSDKNGNIWFAKDPKNSRDKIDGISAEVNALCVIRNSEPVNNEPDVW